MRIPRVHPAEIFLCDDFNPRWSEELERSSAGAFGVGEETYHLLTARSGFEVVVDTLRFPDTVWHGVAAVCGQPIDFPPDRNVDPDALADCARSVMLLTCTAYDRESFVGWRLT